MREDAVISPPCQLISVMILSMRENDSIGSPTPFDIRTLVMLSFFFVLIVPSTPAISKNLCRNYDAIIRWILGNRLIFDEPSQVFTIDYSLSLALCLSLTHSLFFWYYCVPLICKKVLFTESFVKLHSIKYYHFEIKYAFRLYFPT